MFCMFLNVRYSNPKLMHVGHQFVAENFDASKMSGLLEMNAYLLPLIIIFGIYKTVLVDHSDYSDESQHHINHHKYYNCNYGAKWLDTLLSTLK